MIEELTYQDYRAFICGPENYNEIIDISSSRPDVHGSPKTKAWRDLFGAQVRRILKEKNDKLFISAVRNLTTGQMMSYMITSIPYEQTCFMFFIYGETRKTNEVFTAHVGGYGVWKLGLLNGLEHNIFDAFFSVRASAYRPIIKHIRNSSFLDEGVSRYNWQLNNIVLPGQYARNAIEKPLLFDNPDMLERIHPIAICHASLKPEERIQHFSSFFDEKTDVVKNESVQR